MKRYSLLIALVLIFFMPALGAQTIDVVVYADESYPPYSYAEKGAARGIYAEVLKKAFVQMRGYHVQIISVPWKRGLKLLEDGEGFALFPPYFRPQERPYMKYSVPIIGETVAIFCNEAASGRERKRWPEDYYGLRIGSNAGFVLGGEKFWHAVKDGKIVYEAARGNRENLLKLQLRRIDCYMNDRSSIIWELNRIKAEGAEMGTITESDIISTEFGYLGYTDRDKGKFAFKEDFIRQLNLVLEDMKRNGEVQRILDGFLQQ